MFSRTNWLGLPPWLTPSVATECGFLLLLTGSPTACLVLMVLMKIGFEVIAHRKEHAAA